MKASVFTQFGGPEVLHVEDVEQPVPRDRDVLIRVHAASVNFGDLLVRNFKAVSARTFHMPLLFWLIGRATFGIRKPRTTILGSEFAGEVTAVGRGVTRFRVGDRVFGYAGPRMGACAEYLRMPEDGVMAFMPATLTYEEAAAVPYGAIMALGLLRKARLRPGQKVLVIGASGGIGAALVQLAAGHFGAGVTGVCGTSRLEYVRSLGATRVIDYTKERDVDGGETYDLIIDVLGKSSFARCKPALTPNGRLVFVSFKAKQVFQMLWTSIVGGRKVVCSMINEKAEDLVFIKELIEAGGFRSGLDRTFSLDHASEAHAYAASRARTGAVVITVPVDGGRHGAGRARADGGAAEAGGAGAAVDGGAPNATDECGRV